MHGHFFLAKVSTRFGNSTNNFYNIEYFFTNLHICISYFDNLKILRYLFSCRGKKRRDGGASKCKALVVKLDKNNLLLF